MNSYKVVFFSPPDVEGSHLVKKLFQDKFKLPKENRENLVFDYILHKVDHISTSWKLYLVSDIEKSEEIHPLYYTNVNAYVVVLDLAKFYSTWNKFVEDIKPDELDRKIVCVGYRTQNDNNLYVEECQIVKIRHKGLYFEFSKRTDLEYIIDYLLENENGLNARIKNI